jgi:glucosylceramidase
MTRLLSNSNLGLLSFTSLGLLLAAGACSSDNTPNPGTQPPGTAGTSSAAGGPSGTAGTAGTPVTGAAGAPTGTTAGTGPGVTAGSGNNNTAGSPPIGTAGTGAGGAPPVGMAGSGPGTAGSGGGAVVTPNLPPLVTSAPGAYWKTDGTLTDSTAAATVTVNDTAAAQKWDGFGAAFNEIGWNVLTSADMKTQAIKLLFSATDGANFAWGRIPMGASDYAMIRYTPEDNAGADPAPNSGETNRPAKDTALANFSLARDKMYLIPYVKAAQGVKPDLHFWASPWTPPVWMKTGYAGSASGSTAPKKPSYYDGGNMSSDAAILTAYAQYYTKFVQGYKDEGINIELVSPQNEPGYEQNYPSCLWDKATYTSWVGKYLGPAMKTLGVRVMLGTLSNAGDAGRNDLDISTALLADATAKSMVSVVGVQWGVLDKVVGGTTFSGLPIWATEHRCGNYPWTTATYNSTQAPNDQAYGVESWGYIRDAITKGKVTSYSAWNMVLDKSGLGNDTTRDWKQDALLVADGGKVNTTPAYDVFRHFSQYVTPGATVVGTTGGDAVAFKNPDGSIVAVMFNSGAANASYVVAIGGKKVSFAMPANGWATVKVKP